MPDEQSVSSSPQSERRRYERLSCNTPVRLRRFEQSHWRDGVCTNISPGGIGLHTEEVLAVGEIVDVELLEPDRATGFQGRVLYRQSQHYGLSFLDSSPALR